MPVTVFKAAMCIAFASALGAQSGAVDPAWTKDPSRWTEEDARQVLAKSPWVKEIRAGIARRLTEDELRTGGEMGQPRGVGNEGVDPAGSGPVVDLNIFTGRGGDDRSPRSLPRATMVKIVWESALPVRLAELKTGLAAPPTLNSEGYQIAVYGIPGIQFNESPEKLGAPLKQGAVLRRNGKRDVKPSQVEVFQRDDGLVVVYLFPLAAEITGKDGQVEFAARIGRVMVSHVFDLKSMEFLGKLVL